MVQLTTKDTPFPKPEKGNRYGLIAVGGDLSPERLIMAYENGVFPWSDYRDAMLRWYCPYTRFVIFPSEIRMGPKENTCVAPIARYSSAVYASQI